jgi:carboxypeptidase Taq
VNPAVDPRIITLHEWLGEVADLNAANGLLQWDQETYMPPKASPGRGQQLATLSALTHRLFTRAEMGALLADLEQESEILGSDEACLVRETLYDYKRAVCLPEDFVHEFAGVRSAAHDSWIQARTVSDYSLFRPHFAKIIELLRQKADLLGYEGSAYNALLEDYERGMSVDQVKTIFSTLASRQSDLVKRILESPNQPGLEWLDQEWSQAGQWDLSLQILRDMGFDFDAGRQDKSVHPFTTSFDLSDVRITTRISLQELFSCLFSTIHEGGHALYEQGFAATDRRTPLAQAPSLGMHESQSRMWENMVGRSLPFWKHYTPLLKKTFPGQLDAVDASALHRAVNHVQPSLIRVEADECTYNLHIILRFEIEVGLIEGTLQVEEVPEVWNSKMKEYLGLEVPSDSQGCLQDIHWTGMIGYFPAYAMGNLYAAQLFEELLIDIPDLWYQIEEGQFGALLGWLREHVHIHGRKQLPAEILMDVTGREPSAEPYLRYLEQKYSSLYGLQARQG